ncbi:MAG: alpha/beta fold hydrolase [Bacteroidota bacterium]
MDHTQRSVHKLASGKFPRKPLEVTTLDGVTLQGYLIVPETPKAVVMLNPGTAAKKEFYLPFVEYLAENGYLTCLWDYRGSGESAPPSLRGCDYRMIDYGLQDIPAIKADLRRRFPDLPLLIFGHSVGGQMIGFLPDLEDIAGMVGFAVSTGYMWHMPWGYRLQSWFFFYLFSPLSVLLTGYVAAKRFGIMEDLPRNVVRQWRRYCEQKDYFFAQRIYGRAVPKGRFTELPFPVHIFWSTDDPISNARSVPTFWGHARSKRGISFTRIEPKKEGLGKLGHFGFFKRRQREALWGRALAKLNEMIGVK